MTKDFLLRFCGVFLGVLARTLVPWLRKLKDGEIVRFDRRYLYSTAASLLIGFVLTLAVFPQFAASTDGRTPFETTFKIFCLAFGFGFGWNGLVLEGGQWAGMFRDGKAPKEDK